MQHQVSASTTLLEVKDLYKSYGKVQAVKGVSLRIPRGICYGLLGPNGAGKTTTIEMMEDILSPTSGLILYKGQPRDGRFREEVGIQFQHTELPQFLTVKESLQLFHGLYAHPAPLNEIVSLCQLQDLLHRDNRKLSGGQKQRLLLALALLNQPELVFLDEPTTGMDPQARRHLWEIVKTLKSRGKTLVLTTHYMDEAEELCDRIGVMDHGQVLTEGTSETLIREYCPEVILRLPLSQERANLAQATKYLPGNWDTSVSHHAYKTDALNEALKALLSAGVDLSELEMHTPNLEDVFLELTGRSLRQ